jgi:hypothetical protein
MIRCPDEPGSAVDSNPPRFPSHQVLVDEGQSYLTLTLTMVGEVLPPYVASPL